MTGALVLVATAAAAASVGFGGDAPEPSRAADLPPATARVIRQTMVDTDEINGDLGYGASTMLAGRVSGVITRMPLPGDVINRGQPVYRVDNQPVVLMYGDVAAYRMLGPGVTGPDVRQLEENLTVLGYGGFTLDDTYSATTAAAVRRWQRDLGLAPTGQVELGRVLFAPAAIRVDATAVGVNESTGGGQEVLRYTGTGRLVTVLLPVAQQRLAAKGVAVGIRLPDGRTLAGRVDRAYTVIEQSPSPDSSPETRIEALVSLADPAAVDAVEAAVVTVIFTAAQRADVLTVPVGALVALSEGGYGVEVVDGSVTRYITVTTGLFAQGRVEVTGGELREGMTVGMPA